LEARTWRLGPGAVSARRRLPSVQPNPRMGVGFFVTAGAGLVYLPVQQARMSVAMV
jgi:hypothetical protein